MKAEICRFDDEAHRSMMRRSINGVGKKPEIKGRMQGRRKEITEKRVQGEDEERIRSPSIGLGCFLDEKSLPLISRNGLLSKFSSYRNYREIRKQ